MNEIADKQGTPPWVEALQDFSKQMEAIQRAQQERRAKLTPRQRETEDAQRAASATETSACGDAPRSARAAFEVDEKVWLISFMHYDLGFFDHESSRFECADNPFEAKVLPMSSE
jgi:hypothetical protein